MAELTIHFWDMDHTVINNDCDVSWKEYLIGQGFAPKKDRDKIDFFWKQYSEGRLEFEKFLEFQLKEFIGKTKEEIKVLTKEHFEKMVKPKIYRDVPALLHKIRRQSGLLCLITSTNRLIAEPVAAHLGFEHLIATDLEIRDNVFTGRIQGTYCGGEGKIPPITRFCDKHQTTASRCHYYGDSIVDIPVFEFIGRPVVVNPQGKLKNFASKKGWKILNMNYSG